MVKVKGRKGTSDVKLAIAPPSIKGLELLPWSFPTSHTGVSGQPPFRNIEEAYSIILNCFLAVVPSRKNAKIE